MQIRIFLNPGGTGASGGGNPSSQKTKFVPGHRKTRSEGGSLFFTCGRGLGLAAASAITGGSTDTVSQLAKPQEVSRWAEE